MTTVYCTDDHGNLAAVPAADLCFRPAVYGILIENGRVLLRRHPHSDLWQPPGGIVSPRQTPTSALRAFGRAAAGFVPQVGALLRVEERHVVDAAGQAWHLAVFYYALQRGPAMAGAVAGTPDGASEPAPEWVPLAELRREQMHLGYDAIQAAHSTLSA